MTFRGNICQWKFHREYEESSHVGFHRRCHVMPDLIRRIGLEKELLGHNGCVNCLEWNENGSLLASGSDDVQVIVWDPFHHKKLTAIRTGHSGNIFSVKFLPMSRDSILVSGAADCKIRVHEVESKETMHVFSCHAGRVKRLATAPSIPQMFWSAAEDGTIMQFDLRSPEMCSSNNPKNVLINLNAHVGAMAEAKCISINPLRPEMLAVGSNDPFIRVYDRRMLTCRSIQFPTDTASRFSWERQNLLHMFSTGGDFSIPDNSAHYFVAGHLPKKQEDYQKKFRTLAATYVTFSPDGNELLVNLGGEQIYLFDVNRHRACQKFDLLSSVGANGVVKGSSSSSLGLTLHCNGTTNGITATNGVSKHLAASAADSSKPHKDKSSKSKKYRYSSKPLSPAVEAMKKRANAVFEKQKFSQAILLYNQALALSPDSPILFGNRAAAYMKRAWDGDFYAALRDCYSALALDANHMKAHYRLAKCLYELSWVREALDCLQLFKTKFPAHCNGTDCQALDRDIRAAIYSRTDSNEESKESSTRSSQSLPNKPAVSEQEEKWRQEASDYELRFCGHCNTTTDIKEANFFGSNGQYIVAGSDDGSFFIWDKQTTNIMRVLRGDDSIVNCLQPHPSTCLLATSGIDPVVRLWSPQPEDGRKNEREIDNSDDAASANQKRMNADPLEVMLLNMGYRISGGLDGDDENPRGPGETSVNCRTS